MQVVVVQGGKITKPNQGANNGIVHVIDKFIEPSKGSLIDYLKGTRLIKIDTYINLMIFIMAVIGKLMVILTVMMVIR